jgi:hypothetical protein
VNNDSGVARFTFHIPPESLFTSPRNPYSQFPGTLIHMPRNPQGNTAANGDQTITVTDATHFTLNGSSGNGNYVGGIGGVPNGLSSHALRSR